MAEQAGQQRPVEAGVRCRFLVEPHAHFGDSPQQFLMQIMPLPHPHERQKIALAEIAQLVLGQLPRLVVVIIPELEQCQKIGMLVAKPAMLLVRRLLPLQRPFARILNRQSRDDDQHFAQTTLPLRRQQHPPQAWIDRQFRQLPALFADAPLLVHRLQLEQQPETVADLARIRWLHERELLRSAQIQRAHLQDHRRQMGAQNFRIGERRARPEILFRVQPNADAGHHSPATTSALVGAGLRNLLDW